LNSLDPFRHFLDVSLERLPRALGIVNDEIGRREIADDDPDLRVPRARAVLYLRKADAEDPRMGQAETDIGHAPAPGKALEERLGLVEVATIPG